MPSLGDVKSLDTGFIANGLIGSRIKYGNRGWFVSWTLRRLTAFVNWEFLIYVKTGMGFGERCIS